MPRFASVAIAIVSVLAVHVAARPIQHFARQNATQTATNFKQLPYDQFQISDGQGGTAQQEANAVFVDPFANVDLSTVSSDVLNAVDAMAKAAVDAEDADFNPAIDAASGAAADALNVGKTKNKVLKLTGEVQTLNIQIAQAKATGDDTSDLESKLSDEQAKLTENLNNDAANAGKASQSVSDPNL